MPLWAPIIKTFKFNLCVNLVKCIYCDNTIILWNAFLCPKMHFQVVKKFFVFIFSIADDKKLDGGEQFLARSRDVSINKERIWIYLSWWRGLMICWSRNLSRTIA